MKGELREREREREMERESDGERVRVNRLKTKGPYAVQYGSMFVM